MTQLQLINVRRSKSANYVSAQLFTTPAGGALPARSGSVEMSKPKERAQPRSVARKGKKLSNRSTPASTHASTSSGRPTPCRSLRVTRTHKRAQRHQKSIAWTLNKWNVDAKCQQHITGRQKPFTNTSSTLLLWSVGWLVVAFPISRAPPDSLPPGIKVKANLAFDNDSSPLSGRKLLL